MQAVTFQQIFPSSKNKPNNFNNNSGNNDFENFGIEDLT